MKFKYQIGTDCWMVDIGYSYGLYRCSIQSRIFEEGSDGIKISYIVELENQNTSIQVSEDNLFDVATRCNDALCRMSFVLQHKSKN